MTGGSSSGSAGAVAGDWCPLARLRHHGSIRVPSSLCGIFSAETTYGRLSRRGAFPFVGASTISGLLDTRRTISPWL